MKRKNAFFSVIAVILFVTVAVVSVVAFNVWFSSYSSNILSSGEKTIENQEGLEIETIIGENLYLKNLGDNNLTLEELKVSGHICNFNQNVTPGITKIPMSNCLLASSGNLKEVVILEDDQILVKKFYVDTSKLFNRPTISFSADHTNVEWGDNIVLSWSVSNADNCTASGNWLGSQALSGTLNVNSLTGSKVYTLSCSNSVYTESSTVTINVGNQDITPNPFSFINLTNQFTNTLVLSDIQTISGIAGDVTVTVAGDGSPEFEVNSDGNWVNSVTNFNSGDTIRLRMTTGNIYNHNHVVSVTVGDTTVDWSIDTKVQDISPNAIVFTDLVGQELNSDIVSNIVTVGGFDGPVSISISGSGNPQFSINGGGFTNLASTVNPGDDIQLQVSTDNNIVKYFNATLVVGNVSSKWSVQTKSLTFNWDNSVWSICSDTCGSGTQSRTVQCKRADGLVVTDDNCIAPKPITSQACTDYSTCTYDWLIGSYSSCSSTCGSGSQSRSVQCEQSEGTIVADVNCVTVKPVTSQGCTDYSSCTYNWITGSWSACSNTCGGGTQSRSVQCERSDGTIVGDASCGGGKPAVSQACTSYTGCSYSWITGSYGSCSTSCGTGTQTRSVYCRRSDGTTVGDASCSGVKPGISQGCSVYTGCSYSWITGSWGTCSGGTQSRSVKCRRSDGTIVADSYCGGGKPSSSQSCCDDYAYSQCYAGSRYWYNSCDVRTGVRVICAGGICSGDTCG